MYYQIKLFSKTIFSALLTIIFVVLTYDLSGQESAPSDDTWDTWTRAQNWSWTVDDNNDNSGSDRFYWWHNGGNDNSQLAMELSIGSADRKLTIWGKQGDGILEILAAQDDSQSGNPYLLFSQGSSSNSRGAIFMDGYNMLSFSNYSNYTNNQGFRFLNGSGKNYPILNAEDNAGVELMRIRADGNVGIGVTNPTSKLVVDGTVRLRQLIFNEAITLDSSNIIFKEGMFFYGSIPTLDLINSSFGNNNLILNKGGYTWGMIIDSDNMHTLNAKMKSLTVYDHDTSFQQGDLAGKRLVLANSEISNFDDSEGSLIYDRNFYPAEEGGGGFFEDDGGGLALYNGDDGWSAIIDTKNMPHLNASFKSVSSSGKLTVGGAIQLSNLEKDNVQSDDDEGTLYYDRNFYPANEGGGGFFEDDGGGLVINNGEDGWSAIIDTQNMSSLNAQFKTIKTQGSPDPNGEFRYNLEGRQDSIGYRFGMGLVSETDNITKMKIDLRKVNGYHSAMLLEANRHNGNIDATFFGTIYAKNGFATEGTDNVRLGNGAGEGVSNQDDRRHVFIGHDAGIKSAFEEISLIDYEDSENNDPVTGSEYIQNHSVFVLNNHGDLNKPLIFGKFAHEGEQNSMAQLAINTHHVVDSVALTVSGAVHIGPKNINPTLFPSKEGYEDALLWVERGIVTEDVTYAFTSDWDNWPDHVFEDDYNLMSLQELDQYIRKEKHLPGVISREGVRSKGVQSKEMIIALLTKIEELTLYTIEQKKQIDNQRQLNDEMQTRLTKLENLMLNLAKE